MGPDTCEKFGNIQGDGQWDAVIKQPGRRLRGLLVWIRAESQRVSGKNIEKEFDLQMCY